MPDDNKRLVELVTELWNTANPQIAAQIYGERVQRIDPSTSEPANGVHEIMNYVNQVHSGFPDFKIRVKHYVIGGDHLVSEWACTGTHQGDFMGVPPTGKRVEMNGSTTSRVENGKVVEERVYYDRLALLEQMGVVPGKATGGEKAATSTS